MKLYKVKLVRTKRKACGYLMSGHLVIADYQDDLDTEYKQSGRAGSRERERKIC